MAVACPLSIFLHLQIRDVSEADAHRRVVAAFLDAAAINDLAAVARAELVDGLVESMESAVIGGHDVGDSALEKIRRVVCPLHEAGNFKAGPMAEVTADLMRRPRSNHQVKIFP